MYIERAGWMWCARVALRSHVLGPMLSPRLVVELWVKRIGAAWGRCGTIFVSLGHRSLPCLGQGRCGVHNTPGPVFMPGSARLRLVGRRRIGVVLHLRSRLRFAHA